MENQCVTFRSETSDTGPPATAIPAPCRPQIPERNGPTAQRPLAAAIKAALVDCNTLRRDCLITAICSLTPDITFFPFGTVTDVATHRGGDLEIIIQHLNDDVDVDRLAGQDIRSLRKAFPDIPIIVLSDTKQPAQDKTARSAIAAGARAFIPTRTVPMRAIPSAIRYVRDGGTTMPAEILFGNAHGLPFVFAQPHLSQEPNAHCPVRFTSRQLLVLSHLSQGKANKIIAHELRMSESTVKAHIRNIMRKVGATNRTQAVYMAQHLHDASTVTPMRQVLNR